MILIKLGGSVITDKREYKRFRRDIVGRLCREIKDSGKEVIVVHGAGSFGHVVAKEFELYKGHVRNDQTGAVAKVSHDMRELNSMVMSELIDAGIPSVSVPAGACCVIDEGNIMMSDEILRGYADLKIVPVMFGDVVLDRKKGFGICSGDTLMKCLADIFNPETVIFVSDVDGLYDKDPKTSKNARLIENVTEDVLGSISSEMSVADVTGGISEKMRAMLDMCSEGRDCILVNGTVGGRLYSLLTGKGAVSTRAVK